MTRARQIEGNGRMGGAFGGEATEARLVSGWVIDRSSGRPALRLTWRTADAAADALSADAA